LTRRENGIPDAESVKAALEQLSANLANLRDMLSLSKGLDYRTRQAIQRLAATKYSDLDVIRKCHEAVLQLWRVVELTKADFKSPKKRGRKIDPQKAFAIQIYCTFLKYGLKATAARNSPFELCLQFLLDTKEDRTHQLALHALRVNKLPENSGNSLTQNLKKI
jgi:hypothetical protein